MRLNLAAASLAFAAACTPEAPPPPVESQETVVRVLIQTEAGDIRLELYPDRAPVSVANFAALAEAGVYDGASFYRTVREDNDPNPDLSKRIDVIQGGAGFDGLPGAANIAHEPTGETGLSHVAGAISMARLAPGTASSEFFIVVNDSTSLDAGPGSRNPDEAGYAVFGMVTHGMDVVRAIWRAQVGGEAPIPVVEGQILLPPVRIDRVMVEE